MTVKNASVLVGSFLPSVIEAKLHIASIGSRQSHLLFDVHLTAFKKEKEENVELLKIEFTMLKVQKKISQ